MKAHRLTILEPAVTDGCRPPPPAPALGQSHAGCLACGAPLVYRATAEPMTCSGCGARRESNACCESGHFICDACHAGTAVDAIERLLLASDERDPVALAVQAMRHPKVKMHGPEHHFLAPAALVTAWCNVRGEPDGKAELLAEVRRRSAPVAGGSCGYLGACGAAVGAGIFASLATGATPVAGALRGRALRMTAEALSVVGALDAPRCCKRDTFLSLLVAARYARKHLGIDLPARGPRCELAGSNRECIAERCPFHPKPLRDASAHPAA